MSHAENEKKKKSWYQISLLPFFFSHVTKYIILQYPPCVCTVGKDVEPWMVTLTSFMQMRAVSPFFRRLRLMSASLQSL